MTEYSLRDVRSLPESIPPGGALYFNAPKLLEEERGWFIEGKDDLYIKARRLRVFRRTEKVRKLGFLSQVFDPDRQIFLGFEHDTTEHCFLTARVFEQIARANGLPEEQIKQGVLAGLFHDAAAIGGGEALVGLDPKNLDEEEHWQDALDEEAKAFLEANGADIELMSRTIKNVGLLGSLLDIADRITYTYVDSQYIRASFSGGLPRLIYKDVKVNPDTEEIYFDDPDRLGDFLYVRAANHYFVYFHPINKGADFMIRELLRPLYGENGSNVLTPRSLRRMTDDDVCRVLQDHYNLPFADPLWIHTTLVNLYPTAKWCEDENEVEDWKTHLKESDDMIYLGSEKTRGFDPATSYLTRAYLDEGIVPFSEYSPLRAKIIDTFAETSSGLFVYFYHLRYQDDSNGLVRTLFGSKDLN